LQRKTHITKAKDVGPQSQTIALECLALQWLCAVVSSRWSGGAVEYTCAEVSALVCLVTEILRRLHPYNFCLQNLEIFLKSNQRTQDF
jgi:hypothetical protein